MLIEGQQISFQILNLLKKLQKIQAFKKPEKKQLGHEYVDGEEEGIISEMIQELEDQVTRLYKDKKMLRQIHTKMHGCVQANFTVEPNLPHELKVGVFKEAVSFPAWIRFSNANTNPQPDKKKDIRGVAIKLMNVPGEKIMNDEKMESTQDFLLMSSEAFFAKNLLHFRKLMKAVSAKSKLKLLGFFLNPLHWGILARVMKSNIVCNHPFEIPYWSTQPYQFGDESKAVKYFLRPSDNNNLLYDDLNDDNYLRKNMVKTLAENSVDFEFCIQLQTDADKMPIEDPTVKWSSPFIKIASVHIPQQVFDSPAQIEFGEYLSFNPWHSLPEHRPLGSFNRARRRVYQQLSQFRHDANKVKVFEPVPTNGVLKTLEQAES